MHAEVYKQCRQLFHERDYADRPYYTVAYIACTARRLLHCAEWPRLYNE